jgi:hypothetical protein
VIFEALLYRISIQQRVKMNAVRIQLMTTLQTDTLRQKDYDSAKNWLIHYKNDPEKENSN